MNPRISLIPRARVSPGHTPHVVSGGPTLQGQERLSLARELHDTVLQAFILVVMQLRSAIEERKGCGERLSWPPG